LRLCGVVIPSVDNRVGFAGHAGLHVSRYIGRIVCSCHLDTSAGAVY
jgi:hypothetical protein